MKKLINEKTLVLIKMTIFFTIFN